MAELHRRADKAASGSSAQRCRPSQRPRRGYPFCVPTAPPLALAAPAPHPRSVRRAAAARAFPLGRLPRRTHAAACARARSPAPAGVLASWPHVAAAAPAVGSWQRCLRSTRSGTAAIQPQLPDSARGRAPPCTPRCAGGKLPAAAAAVVPLPRCAQRSRHITYVIRSRDTAVRYAV